MAKIGIGAIGLGRMGQVYGNYVSSQLDDAELVAVSDMREDVVNSYANIATPYTDYHDLLANPDVQGVIIATPTSTHRDIVIDAAKAGKAIFCEKPTALTLHETDEMIEAIKDAGVLFQVGFMRRFDKHYSAAYQQIADGVIGTPIVVRSIGRDPFRTSLEYANPKNSGGLIIDMGIHDFDIVRWMMGAEVERVYTETASIKYPELLDVNDVDNAMISLRFDGGQLGNIEVSRTSGYGYDIRATVIGTEGTLEIGYLQETAVVRLNKEGVQHDIVPYFQERFGPAYTAQIAHFVECLRDDKQPIVTEVDARAALQASLAAYQSQLDGTIVYVKDVT
jgi:scyllo-inositol 2-dehydrogenase (NAD+)